MPVVFCQDSHSQLLCVLGDLALEDGLNSWLPYRSSAISAWSRWWENDGVVIGALVLLRASLASDMFSLNQLSESLD
jgi:hypothetical protein